MIIFPRNLLPNENYYEQKLGKDRLKLLEKTLRKLGNFDSKKNIEIIDEEYIKYNYQIYEVKDLDDTSFKFYNYGLGYGKNTERFNENFHLTMQRKNSQFSYIYDFYQSKRCDTNLEVIEINSQVSDNRILRIKEIYRKFRNLAVQENDKEYTLTFKSEDILISIIEKIRNSLQNLENINLEELLKLVGGTEGVCSAKIYVEGELRASIMFQKGEIYEYQIVDSNRRVKTEIRDTITREVERKLEESDKTIKTEETVTENYEKIQSDLKRLLKQL